MNLAEIEKAVAKVQEELFNKANSYTVGFFKSHFKGSGIQFKEHQIYTPGDDVRFIDWKLSAKSVGKTFIKTFEEERNVEINTIIDISPTSFMGYKGKSKFLVSIEIACLIFLLTEKTKDYQKITIFDEKITELPKKSGRKGIAILLSYLKKNGFVDSKGTLCVKSYDESQKNLKKRMSYLKNLIAKGKEILFLTDFYDPYPKKEFDKFLTHRNFHCFGLRTPLDTADSMPFSFHSIFKGDKEYIFKLKSKNTNQKEKKYKNLKYLDLDTDYLDGFITSMRN